MYRESETDIEMVITTPSKHGVELAERLECRTTLGALTQLFRNSKEKIVLAAPYLQRNAGLSGGALQQSLEAVLKKGVDVDIASTRRSLQTLSISRYDSYPGSVRLYYAEGENEDTRRLGSHAKFCLCDDTEAYIGSANLTAPGLGENLELGLIVNGEVAKQLHSFWIHAVAEGIYLPYQPSS